MTASTPSPTTQVEAAAHSDQLETLRVAARDAAAFYLEAEGDEFDPEGTDWHTRAFDLAIAEGVERQSSEYEALLVDFTETFIAELARLRLLRDDERREAAARVLAERLEVEQEAAEELDDDEDQNAEDDDE